jgi:hypothetical protein
MEPISSISGRNPYRGYYQIGDGPGSSAPHDLFWWDPGDISSLATLFMSTSTGNWYWSNSDYVTSTPLLPSSGVVNQFFGVVDIGGTGTDKYTAWPDVYDYAGDWRGWWCDLMVAM